MSIDYTETFNEAEITLIVKLMRNQLAALCENDRIIAHDVIDKLEDL
jgi:hypothetical protein